MSEKTDKITKEWNTNEILIRNIIEGGKGNRFEFTMSETRALDFALRVVSANKEELLEDDHTE